MKPNPLPKHGKSEVPSYFSPLAEGDIRSVYTFHTGKLVRETPVLAARQIKREWQLQARAQAILDAYNESEIGIDRDGRPYTETLGADEANDLLKKLGHEGIYEMFYIESD